MSINNKQNYDIYMLGSEMKMLLIYHHTIKQVI